MQGLAGNRATTAFVQRRIYTEGSKAAKADNMTVPAAAKTHAAFVRSKGLNVATIVDGTTIGKYTFRHRNPAAPDGTLVYDKFKNKTYRGGRLYGNNSGDLPGSNTYTEWDIHELTGAGAGTERVVVNVDGRSYYTGDHYANFVEIRS